MRYDQYRAYGHPRWIALTLSIDPLVFFGTALLIGVLVGSL